MHSFPHDLYSQHLVRLSSSTAHCGCAPDLYSSGSDTPLCPVLWVPAAALRCQLLPHVSPQSSFPVHTHDFSSCPISHVKFYNKITQVISALTSFPTRSLFSAPGWLQLQHCTLWLCSSFVQLWLRHTSMPCAVGSSSSSALSVHALHFPPQSLFPTLSILSELPFCAPVTLYFQLMRIISALAMFSPKTF